jgi:hypothetical protein
MLPSPGMGAPEAAGGAAVHQHDSGRVPAAVYENTRHVIYVDENGGVQELYFSGGRWIGYDPQTLFQALSR